MRFAAETDPDRDLTDRQRAYLYGLRWKFRRQIAPTVPGLALSVAEYDAHRARQARAEGREPPKPPPAKSTDHRQRELPLWGRTDD